MAVAGGTAYAIQCAAVAVIKADGDIGNVVTHPVTDGQGNVLVVEADGTTPAPAVFNEFKANVPPAAKSICLRVLEGSKLRPFRQYRIKRYFLDVELWTDAQDADSTDKMYEFVSRLLDEKVLNLTPFDPQSQCFDCYEVASVDSEYDDKEHAWKATVRFTVVAGRNQA